MKPRGPEEEACGVWLDAAALKRRKVQVGRRRGGTRGLCGRLRGGGRHGGRTASGRRAARGLSGSRALASWERLSRGHPQGDLPEPATVPGDVPGVLEAVIGV